MFDRGEQFRKRPQWILRLQTNARIRVQRFGNTIKPCTLQPWQDPKNSNHRVKKNNEPDCKQRKETPRDPRTLLQHILYHSEVKEMTLRDVPLKRKTSFRLRQ
jgi:hypothetical protein